MTSVAPEPKGTHASTVTDHERQAVERANATGLQRAIPLTFEQSAFGLTEIVQMPNRGHALTIDSGWREVADTVLTFVRRFV